MLATLLIIRQFLQNIKEVLQPYLYEHQKLGEFTLKTMWEVFQASIFKYGRLALGRAWMTGEAVDKKDGSGDSGQPEKKERKSLLAGYRNTQAEEGDHENTLKHRKVSFTEKTEHKGRAAGTKTGRSLLDDDSPTLVEEGADPATIFELCDNDSDTECVEASKNPTGNPHPASSPSGSKNNVSFPPKQKATPKAEPECKKSSWMEPPDEGQSTLTQPEIESCMLTYEVCLYFYVIMV